MGRGVSRERRVAGGGGAAGGLTADTGARSVSRSGTCPNVARGYLALAVVVAGAAIVLPCDNVWAAEAQHSGQTQEPGPKVLAERHGPATQGQKPAGRKRLFQPGVWVDWSARQVEVAGEVVLRSGPLELFACSPHTKEHESIVRVLARPLHVYQAMGLIGLEPGHAPYYDERLGRTVPATGERLELLVQWSTGGKTRIAPIEQWMLNTQRNQPMGSGDWVFAGSSFSEDGEFLADLEGTVVTVVDFYGALIGLAGSHSSANEALWLAANTSQIPPVGTKVRLIIRPASDRLVLRLDRSGRLWRGQRAVTLREVLEAARSRGAGKQAATAVIEYEPGVAEIQVRQLMQALRHAGVRDVQSHVAEPGRADSSSAAVPLAIMAAEYGPAIVKSLADLRGQLPVLAGSVFDALRGSLSGLAGGARSVGQAVIGAARSLAARQHRSAEE